MKLRVARKVLFGALRKTQRKVTNIRAHQRWTKYQTLPWRVKPMRR